MLDAVLPLAPRHDVFVATAAVADWRPAAAAEHKIKKDGERRGAELRADREPRHPGRRGARCRPSAPFCVGFAAESHDLLEHARDKLLRKSVPLIVANLGPATFGRDDNALMLVDADGDRELPPADKLTLARQLVAEIAARLARDRRSSPHAADRRMTTSASDPSTGCSTRAWPSSCPPTPRRAAPGSTCAPASTRR